MAKKKKPGVRAKKREEKIIKSLRSKKLGSSIADIEKWAAKNKVTEEELIKAYSRLRSAALKQIKAIDKSDIGFVRGDRPYPVAASHLRSADAVKKELSDLLRWYKSKSYSLKSREETRRKTLMTLAKRGIYLQPNDYLKWVEFITWFKHTAYAALFDSDSEAVQDIFNAGNDSFDWNRAFKEYVKEQGL